MSDTTICIVPRVSSLPHNTALADAIIAWLIEEQIIKPGIHNELSQGIVYPIGPNAAAMTHYPQWLPYDQVLSYMEVSTERSVFPSTGADHNQRFGCPDCGFDLAENGFSFIDEWYVDLKETTECTNCKAAINFQNLNMTPSWGFSNLGFAFWNWPEFSPAFLKEFSERLGYAINVVESHI